VDFSIGTRGEPEYHEWKGCNTVNIMVPAPKLASANIFAVKRVRLHFKLAESVKFVLEEGSDPVLSKVLQVMAMIKGVGGAVTEGKEGYSERAGTISKVSTTVYYNSDI
jgi:hypothetical protein